ncbi:DUF3325 domain-containing protein [Methylobacterium sp. Leaf118]|uniref:DUF3325 domain-containing protein n=1 Tax=Methylobacterium sp. Leaf118 TaxID=2876562 RepID=UPI001E4F980E|nr:DUF3325 domain-containing protein [Methylobacterium sp. Leaf118]
MTPWALVLNLGLSFAALSALCLGLNRHQADILRTRPSGQQVAGLRLLGWLGLGLSLLLAGQAEGWAFGPVQWLGALTGAGVALVLLLSYRPRLVGPACVLALLAAVLGGLRLASA